MELTDLFREFDKYDNAIKLEFLTLSKGSSFPKHVSLPGGFRA